MLAITLQIATIYLVAGLALLVGIGIGLDLRRWLRQRAEDSSQDCGERFGKVGRHV